MRIAQVSTVGTPVRREGSDSIESLVWLLTRELTRLGHEVTVFAAAGSEVEGELVATLPGPYGTGGSPDDWLVCEWLNLCRAVEHSAGFDVLHCHTYLWGLPLQRLAPVPMVHTLHVTPYEDEARLWSLVPDAWVTALSHYQWSAFPQRKPAAVIPHGVDPSQFTFRAEPEDYVCFLGRFIPGKGPLAAVAVAHALGLRLVLAGPRNDYYREHVEPLVDGRSVEYVGYVSGPERDRLLGGARALLYPLQAPEPFGLVQVEAMMCGTPVVALRLGAVPEVIDEGVTGYTAASADDLVGQAARSFTLDRRRVRARAEERFSAARMARDYLRVYEEVVARTRTAPIAISSTRPISAAQPWSQKEGGVASWQR
jgi:glycosyltransferase involved in cell wall biosynthesis